MSKGQVENGDYRAAKRQRITNSTHDQQGVPRIFAPFRVRTSRISRHCQCSTKLYLTDHRPRLSHYCPLHLASIRQDHFPDHHLRRPQSPNLRSPQRPEPYLLNATADACRYHSHLRLEGPNFRGMGREEHGQQCWGVGFQAGEEG